MQCNDLEPKVETRIIVDDAVFPCQGNLRFGGINKTRPLCLLLEHIIFGDPRENSGAPLLASFARSGTMMSIRPFESPRVAAHTKNNGPPEGGPVMFSQKLKAKSQQLRS